MLSAVSDSLEPLGFAFLSYKDELDAEKVISMPSHVLFDRTIDVKPFTTKTGVKTQKVDVKSRKVYICNLAPEFTKEDIKTALEHFGAIDKAYVMYHHKTKKSRGFGFAEF